MKHTDRAFGEIEIKEPVVLELINSPVFDRLKDIDQAGYFEPFFPGSKHTRFEHSLGVYYLLVRFGAPLEEEIAGLIHDVSHTVFSHCGDYIFKKGSGKKQNHQDNVHDEYVLSSVIPGILEKHGLDVHFILDDKNFPLKENDLPDICADRLDYSLRTGRHYEGLSDKEIRYFLDSLMVDNGRWVFKDFESADRYARMFKRFNDVYYSNIESAVMFRTVGDCLRYAWENGYISERDLYTTDSQVLSKIRENITKDDNLRRLFFRMNNKLRYEHDARNYEAEVFCKSRIVDPLCHYEGKIKRVSDVNPEWKLIVEKESSPKRHLIKFFD